MLTVRTVILDALLAPKLPEMHRRRDDIKNRIILDYQMVRIPRNRDDLMKMRSLHNLTLLNVQLPQSRRPAVGRKHVKAQNITRQQLDVGQISHFRDNLGM